MFFASFIAGALLLVWARSRYVQSLERRSMGHRSFGPSGIVIGGEPIELERSGAAAVLLVHGAGDTPQTLRYLADHLHARGFTVSVPLLPGHGRMIHDFALVTADTLMDAVRERYSQLREEHDWVGVVGLSMGGALAVQLAAENPRIPALGLVAPYLEMPPRVDRAAQLAWLWGPIIPFVNASQGISIRDPREQALNLAYGVFAAPALRALLVTTRRATAVLPNISCPTLMIQSREDNRISVDAAQRAFERLGASEKRLEWITGAAHIITVDHGHERVLDFLSNWLEEHRARSER
jgi:carboxylesterase